MSRAVRRQQQPGSQPEGGGGGRKGGGGRIKMFGSREPRQTRGTRPQEKRRRLAMFSWVGEIGSELRKVTWPTRDETAYLTMVVIIVAVVVGALLGAVDTFFNWLIDRVLLN